MESIKFIISELNKEPFKKNLNLVTYDNLTGEQRIQILFDIFHVIDETITSDILEISDGEEVVIKIMEMLRILKYTPPSNIEPSLFRQNLISGERNTYTHIFNYLLSKLTELKQRAYLARFLVKIEVSPDVEGDQDIVQLYEQYEQLIENFKMVHSMNQNLKKRNDPGEMLLESINEKMSKLKVRLKTAQMQRQMGVTPQDILEKLEEEVEAKQRLVKEILPQELASIERYISDIQEIQSQPEVLPNFLEKIKSKIQTLNREINETIEKKMLTNDDADDEKLALVRQSAALVSKKRSNLQETLKKFVNDVRNKGNDYKQKRRELAEIRTESAILTRTDEILKEKWTRLRQILITLEEQRGIAGYFTSQNESDKQQEIDDNEEQDTEDLRSTINELTEQINAKKSELAPLVKDLRPLRQQCQDLQMDCDRKKSKYDSLAANLESNIVKIESIVKKMRHESNSLLSTKFILEMELEALNAIQSLVDLELRYYVANAVDDREKSWLVKIEKDIANEEEVRNDLRIRMKELQDNENNAKKQSKMWQDLKELMRVKNECFERRKELILHPSQEKKDHLIL
uniref:IFT81 calponin homology domain-containing protein n=1 Tax=Tetranychus urticae TaxID=32264 RepID=T1L1F1_TETUR